MERPALKFMNATRLGEKALGPLKGMMHRAAGDVWIRKMAARKTAEEAKQQD